MYESPFSQLFDDSTQWQVFASGQAEGTLSKIVTADGRSGLRLDYDFHDGGGFVAVRMLIFVTLPEIFKIDFEVRGEGPSNHFEFKVASPGGANVWRHQRLDHAMSKDWTSLRIFERDLPFAWGPAGGGAPSEVEAIEFVIAAGPGGKGFVELSHPSLEDQTLTDSPMISASSSQPDHLPEAAFHSDSANAWRASSDDPTPWWLIDFGRNLRFGGLVIEWPPSLVARAYQIEASLDGNAWTLLYQATSTLGTKSHIPASGAEARQIRVVFRNPECAAIQSLSLKPDAFSSTPNEFIHSITSDFPRGHFPRYWYREQSYWTPVGSPEGRRRALINEEGMVEVDEGCFSLEPFILTSNGLVTWADVKTSRALEKGGAPLPRVRWRAPGIRLDVLPWVDGKGDELTLRVTYRLVCSMPVSNVRLAIAVRPYQVNPPWQAFRNLGGISKIQTISTHLNGLTVEGRTVLASPVPDQMGAALFEEGDVVGFLRDKIVPSRDHTQDASGLASGVMVWDLAEGMTKLEVTISVPYFAIEAKQSPNSRANALSRWRDKLGEVCWQVPVCAEPAFDCFRTAAAHILINRDGPAIQPGPRRYTRSWIRDCVIMGMALAKAGLPEALREFLTWYAKFQREDGFIPCVVDRDGIDWLVEHDSHGQFLWGVREDFRQSGDLKFLEEMLPHVAKAGDYLIALRRERMTDSYTSGEHAACFGLLPESASHEGYLAHPVHSYWDDFWGVRGLEAAAELSQAVGITDDAARWKSEAVNFQSDMLRSIDKVIADKNLNYIPGSVEWADFDPTATSNAIAMLDFADVLPQGPLHEMLATYLDGFHRKHRGEMVWNNYTAYEIRIIGAFVRLGKRDTANELLEFFLSDRRPLEWNQWPEITWRNPLSPGHLGDVPHTWIAAEYLLAVTSMVAAEHEASESVVLAPGMPWAWISDVGGFSVSNLPTRYGSLDFRIKAHGTQTIEVDVGGKFRMPVGGLTIVPPLPDGKRIVSTKCQSGTHGPIDSTGSIITVTGLPFSAEFCLGRPTMLT